ncbi:MAG TPA: hypothetical protein VFP35_03830 [Candidatus Saccharimonadales bacterium]|nr:hypothetical protein [Candidatus Saccharimonadales bacterium]
MEGLSTTTDSYEALEQRREQALRTADFQELQKIIEEARRLDGWDDTDPRYAHLIEQCVKDISSVMTYYG